MKELEKGQDKIAKICETLRKETLEPAEKKALEMIEEAKVQAEFIIRQAEAQGEGIVKKGLEEIEKERLIFQSSLDEAARQGIEFLRQEIEKSLFSPELEALVVQNTSDPKVVARIIEALIAGVKEKGISKDATAFIPRDISPQAVNALLAENVLSKLKGGTVTLGDFKGGAQIRIQDKKLKVEMDESALKELLSTFIRKDFRKLIFNA